MKLNKFIMESNNVTKDSFIWNMIGSMLMAFQSVILLMILTRTIGLVESGIFTIAYANANLFLTIGKYGMRNFQVSDIKGEFSFREYKTSRIITVCTMIILSLGYVVASAIVNEYSFEKSMIIIGMCIFKLPDAIEDVYYGEYQKCGRLDIASKTMTLRLLFTLIIFSIIIMISKNLLYALFISSCVTFIIMYIFIKWTYRKFKKTTEMHWRNVVRLLKNCFPLFAGSFLSFYIGNAPKYAIDFLLTDDLQACYGFLAMPVFVIGLLNGFIFNPMLFKLSCLWNEAKIKLFLKQVVMQIAIVAGITGVCILGAYLIGIPVLSLLYNTNLSPYKTELLILLLGGGFLGLSGLLNAVIIIIRCQKNLLWVYLTVAIIAFFMSNPIVKKYRMMGASILYMILMLIICICFLLIFMSKIIKCYKKKKIV